MYWLQLLFQWLALFAKAMSVYERILLSIPVDELEVGYNSVLQEEIQSVYQSVDEISTAFGKLEELWDVVNRLQRDETSTGGHSASLLEVMASTLELKQKLSTKLRESFDVVTQNTKPLQAKRERVGTDVDGRQMKKPKQIEEDSRTIASNARLDPAKADVPPTIRPKKETSSASKRESPPATGRSENAPVPIIPGCIDSLVKEVDDLRLHERLGRIPDVLKTISTSMKHDKCGLLKAEVRNSFKFVRDWVEQSAGQSQELGMYLDYPKAATAYLEVAGRTQLQLSSQVTHDQWKGASDFLYRLETLGVCGCEHHYEARSRKNGAIDPINVFNVLVRQTARALRAVNTIVLWMINDPREPKLVSIYRQLQGPLDRFTTMISNPTQKTLVRRLSRTLSLRLAGTWNTILPTGAQILQSRVQGVVVQMQSWQLGAVPLSDIGSVMTKIDGIVRCPVIGWAPEKNILLRRCVAGVEEHILLIEKQRPRSVFVAQIAWWGLTAPANEQN
ncbi:hypothetical protein PF004_g23763 [Phytophthora fragariae]|uniref:Uncharacterized protein n=1 Tax=Phytophthora fragariae TaxID=53985 RepID=A0A6G0MWW9_9STRA|nr:hypothetical protein PF004_g23763 [Phytophthora fragariae]